MTVISDAAASATPGVDARFVAEGLSKIWRRQVAVINHPGANGSIAVRVASGAAPDGYTLFMPALSTFVALLTVAENLPLKLSWWDRLFGTYRPQLSAGQEEMTIGIEQFRDPRELRLDRMLVQPFRGSVGSYPFGQRTGQSSP